MLAILVTLPAPNVIITSPSVILFFKYSRFLAISSHLCFTQSTERSGSSGVLNTFSDVVVCEVSDEAYNSSSENRVKIRVIYHFQEKKVEDNFSNVPSDISPIEKEFALYEALSPTSASITLNDATAPSYIRWYFADASGNAVANPGFNLTNSSYTYTSQGNSIYYGGTTTDTNAELLNMTVTPQNGKSWSDLTSYKLVALLSNAEGTVTDGTLSPISGSAT